jgi:hypothetical protein
MASLCRKKKHHEFNQTQLAQQTNTRRKRQTLGQLNPQAVKA